MHYPSGRSGRCAVCGVFGHRYLCGTHKRVAATLERRLVAERPINDADHPFDRGEFHSQAVKLAGFPLLAEHLTTPRESPMNAPALTCLLHPDRPGSGGRPLCDSCWAGLNAACRRRMRERDYTPPSDSNIGKLLTALDPQELTGLRSERLEAANAMRAVLMTPPAVELLARLQDEEQLSVVYSQIADWDAATRSTVASWLDSDRSAPAPAVLEALAEASAVLPSPTTPDTDCDDTDGDAVADPEVIAEATHATGDADRTDNDCDGIADTDTDDDGDGYTDAPDEIDTDCDDGIDEGLSTDGDDDGDEDIYATASDDDDNDGDADGYDGSDGVDFPIRPPASSIPGMLAIMESDPGPVVDDSHPGTHELLGLPQVDDGGDCDCGEDHDGPPTPVDVETLLEAQLRDRGIYCNLTICPEPGGWDVCIVNGSPADVVLVEELLGNLTDIPTVDVRSDREERLQRAADRINELTANTPPEVLAAVNAELADEEDEGGGVDLDEEEALLKAQIAEMQLRLGLIARRRAAGSLAHALDDRPELLVMSLLLELRRTLDQDRGVSVDLTELDRLIEPLTVALSAGALTYQLFHDVGVWPAGALRRVG